MALSIRFYRIRCMFQLSLQTQFQLLLLQCVTCVFVKRLTVGPADMRPE
jgi:hypothetical protein